MQEMLYSLKVLADGASVNYGSCERGNRQPAISGIP